LALVFAMSAFNALGACGAAYLVGLSIRMLA
jgi:hypothetical protein